MPAPHPSCGTDLASGLESLGQLQSGYPQSQVDASEHATDALRRIVSGEGESPTVAADTQGPARRSGCSACVGVFSEIQIIYRIFVLVHPTYGWIYDLLFSPVVTQSTLTIVLVFLICNALSFMKYYN